MVEVDPSYVRLAREGVVVIKGHEVTFWSGPQCGGGLAASPAYQGS